MSLLEINNLIKSSNTELLDDIPLDQSDIVTLRYYFNRSNRDINFVDYSLREHFAIGFITLKDICSLKRYFDDPSSQIKLLEKEKHDLDNIYYKYGALLYARLNPPASVEHIVRPSVVAPPLVKVQAHEKIAIVEMITDLPFDQLDEKAFVRVVATRQSSVIKEEVIQSIKNINFDVLTSVILLQTDMSIFFTRKIDVLLHGGSGEDELIHMVDQIAPIDISVIYRIFNDARVIYPYANRSYLNKKLGSVMSSLLIEGHVLLYDHILHIAPDLILNAFDDLSILFTHAMSRDISPDIEKPIFIRIINHLKNKLEGDYVGIFSIEWFEKLISKLNTEKWYSSSSNNIADIENKISSMVIKLATSREKDLLDLKIPQIFEGHNEWESSNWTGNYKFLLIFSRFRAILNVTKIKSVSIEIFNTEQIGGQITNTKYMKKYFKYKHKNSILEKLIL